MFADIYGGVYVTDKPIKNGLKKMNRLKTAVSANIIYNKCSKKNAIKYNKRLLLQFFNKKLTNLKFAACIIVTLNKKGAFGYDD